MQPQISFLKLGEDRLSLDAQPIRLPELSLVLQSLADENRLLLVHVDQTATAQRLTNLLLVLRGIQGLTVNVMRPT